MQPTVPQSAGAADMDLPAVQSMDWLFKKERIYLLAQFWQQVIISKQEKKCPSSICLCFWLKFTNSNVNCACATVQKDSSNENNSVKCWTTECVRVFGMNELCSSMSMFSLTTEETHRAKIGRLKKNEKAFSSSRRTLFFNFPLEQNRSVQK